MTRANAISSCALLPIHLAFARFLRCDKGDVDASRVMFCTDSAGLILYFTWYQVMQERYVSEDALA